MSKIKEEIRCRVPRLLMSLVMAIIFLAIFLVVPETVKGILIPGLDMDASLLARTIIIVITAIFLIRALSDALVLGDIVTDIIIRRMGIKEKRSPKRAGRDFIYIIVIILIATAVLPVMSVLKGDIHYWLSTFIIYGALGIILILIYDIGRILYRIVEQKAESFADRLCKIAEQEKTDE